MSFNTSYQEKMINKKTHQPIPAQPASQETTSAYNGRVYKIVAKTAEDEEEIKGLLVNYFESSLNLHKAKEGLKQAEEKFLAEKQAKLDALAQKKQRLADERLAIDSRIEARETAIKNRNEAIQSRNESIKSREVIIQSCQENIEIRNQKRQELVSKSTEVMKNAVKAILSKNVLKTTQDCLCNFSGNKLENIQCDLVKKNLITDEVGMNEVIIPFIKAHKTEVVDLSLFQNEIRGKALQIFLDTITETQVQKVILSKAKILTSEESSKIQVLKGNGVIIDYK